MSPQDWPRASLQSAKYQDSRQSQAQAEAILALDLFTVDLLDGTKAYVLAAIEHATRRIRILGATAHPTASWVAQVARNLAMDLEDAGSNAGSQGRSHGEVPAEQDLFQRPPSEPGVPVSEYRAVRRR